MNDGIKIDTLPMAIQLAKAKLFTDMMRWIVSPGSKRLFLVAHLPTILNIDAYHKQPHY